MRGLGFQKQSPVTDLDVTDLVVVWAQNSVLARQMVCGEASRTLLVRLLSLWAVFWGWQRSVREWRGWGGKRLSKKFRVYPEDHILNIYFLRFLPRIPKGPRRTENTMRRIVNLLPHSDLLWRPHCADILLLGFYRDFSSQRRLPSVVNLGGGA